MAGKQENRGGARAGSGPKPKKRIYSEKVKARYVKAARELAVKYGMPPEKAIMELIYNPKVQDAVRVAAMKLYNEALLVKESDMTVRKETGPAVYLPQRRQDSAKIIQIKKEGTNN